MGEKRLIVADIEVENVHCHGQSGYMVITNDHGTLWYYGLYDNKEDAERAVAEYEHRFMVELHEGCTRELKRAPYLQRKARIMNENKRNHHKKI